MRRHVALGGNKRDLKRKAETRETILIQDRRSRRGENRATPRQRSTFSAHGRRLRTLDIDKCGALEERGTTTGRPHTIVMCLCGAKLSACVPPSRTRAMSSIGVLGNSAGGCTPFRNGGGLRGLEQRPAAGSVMDEEEGCPCSPRRTVSAASSSSVHSLYHAKLCAVMRCHLVSSSSAGGAFGFGIARQGLPPSTAGEDGRKVQELSCRSKQLLLRD